jgi:hypothetical protein
VTGVELADVAGSQFLHEASDCTDFWRRGQQVKVVVHQDASAQLAASVEQCLAQQGQVTSSIGLVEKAGKAVVAAPKKFLRNTGQVESCCLAIA